MAGGVAVVAVAWTTGLLTLDRLGVVTTALVVLASVGYFTLLLTSRTVTPAEHRDVVAYLPVFGASLLFWTMFFQLFTTFSLYADTRLDLDVLGVSIPRRPSSPRRASSPSCCRRCWECCWLRRRGPALRPLTKMSFGLVALALGYAVFLLGSGTTGTANPLWMAAFGFAMFSIAESLVPAVAMSATTAAAPKSYGAQTLSLYFLTMAGGSSLSGLLAQLYSAEREVSFFALSALATAVLTVGLLLLSRRLSTARTAV